MNSQSLEALAFRVDVISEPEGRLLARGFVPHQALAGLEGTVTAALITPDMQQVGGWVGGSGGWVGGGGGSAGVSLSGWRLHQWGGAGCAGWGEREVLCVWNGVVHTWHYTHAACPRAGELGPARQCRVA